MAKHSKPKKETPTPGFLELQDAFNRAADACENSAPTLEEMRKRQEAINKIKENGENPPP